MPFPVRLAHIRTVDPTSPGPKDRSEISAISLWRMALAASQETLQTGLLTTAWLRLFSDQLSKDDLMWLRWQDLGNSAEIRRAQSALYGRYMARAIMGARVGATFFTPLRRNTTTLSGGVVVKRNASGDIPDWVAWNSGRGGYILGEAKGVLSVNTASFIAPQTPSCISNGKAQFGRVDVRDATGTTLRTSNWVVANLWATDLKVSEPRILLWDPEKDGRELQEDEIESHREGIARTWLASLSINFGRPQLREMRRPGVHVNPGQLFKVRAEPMSPDSAKQVSEDHVIPYLENASDRGFASPDEKEHEAIYSLAIVSPTGIQSITRARDISDLAKGAGRPVPAMIIGIDQSSIEKPGTLQRPWLGDSGIVSEEGFAIFDPRKVAISAIG